MLRQVIVTIMGNVDAGKCVHPSTLVLSKYGIRKIEELWNQLTKDREVYNLEEGFYIKLQDFIIDSFDLNKKETIKAKPIFLCKLKSPKKLISIKTSLGTEIKVTEEHPFFVLEDLKIKSKRADNLNEGEYILHAKEINKEGFAIDKIKSLILDKLTEENKLLCKLKEEFLVKIKDILYLEEEKHNIINNRFRLKKIKEILNQNNYSNEIIYSKITHIKSSIEKKAGGHNSNWIKLPQDEKTFKGFFYLAGVIAGDGTGSGGSITNKRKEVLDLCIKTFNLLDINPKINLHHDTFRIVNCGGKTFHHLMNKLFEFSYIKKSNNLLMPKIVEISDNIFSKEFISGYFDCDAYVGSKNIEISSASEDIINKLQLVLLNFSILSNKFKKLNKKYNKYYNYLTIAGYENYKNFYDNIGFKITYKTTLLKRLIAKGISNKKTDIIPLKYKNIRDIRIKLGLQQNLGDFWGNYELGKQNLTKKIFKKFLDKTINSLQSKNWKTKLLDKIYILELSEFDIRLLRKKIDSNFKIFNYLNTLEKDKLIKKEGKKYIITPQGDRIKAHWKDLVERTDYYINDLKSFMNLTNTSACFVKITKKEKMQSDTEWVYDFTEEKNHNFIANGIVVHNTALIDTIKKTSIVASEPGKITQSIKAYSISLEAIKEVCKGLLDFSKIKVPGLLLIDTPGHKSFTNLRKRGGSLADIAILIVDINEGLKPQTLESIEILKENKTPFIIALNKTDLLNGWQTKTDIPLIKSISLQTSSVQKLLDDKLYQLVGKFYELNLNAERFDRVDDFTKTIAMVPISAKTSEGIPELLMLITGLAQRFLESTLSYDPNSFAEGTILEIKEEKGLGLCMDTIVYKGKIKTNDTIVVGTLGEPVVTKIKAMFLVEKNQLKTIKEAEAAIGVKISAQNIENVIPGMPLKVANKDLEKTKIELKKQVEEITLELDKDGIVIKADSVGSLEALINILKEKNVKIKRASVGDISRKDIAEALSSSDILHKAILGFNVKHIETSEVKIITNSVIYTLVDNFEDWYNKEKKAIETKLLGSLPRPCKIKILEGYVFRQSGPAVCGIEVLAGNLKPGISLMREDKSITEAKEMQHEGQKKQEAKRGEQVALSMPGITIGRNLKEGDVLYSDLTEEQFRVYKKMKSTLTPEEIEVLKEIAELKRKVNPGWGV